MKPMLTVLRWADFQHYKDRAPIWIKVYFDLLHDDEWADLSDQSKAHILGLWLLAAATNTGGKIPFKPNWIARQIGATCAINWKEIAQTKWVGLNQAASDLLAEAEQDASLRALARTEGETEGETETEPPVVPHAGDETPAAKTKTSKPREGQSKLPDNWRPENDVIAAMKLECPGLDLKREHAKFADYWRGTGKKRVDWTATWRNWMRKAFDDLRARAPAPVGTPSRPYTPAPEKPE